ncbi:MAG: hypothetical protein LBH96_04905 [Candidatus Peribacteria bacterium]|jgi:pyruvate kinase|nr:hypothetical protein [Candidatus Peribacteria bacterium]
MNNFRFTKIIASVSPILAKETVLSKIINTVDAFTITLSRGFDDNNKKYIDTLMKLDNSKTIILETKGNEIRVKNTGDVPIQKGQMITIDYSEYSQESDQKIYIDYAHLEKLPIGAPIEFEHSQVIAEVVEKKEDYAKCKIIEAHTNKILQYDRVTLQHYEEETSELIERDKKDILRGLEYGTHIIALSICHDKHHVQNTKKFLKEQHHPEMKVFAKIETQYGLEHINEIIEVADGIILVADMIQEFLTKQTIEQVIKNIRAKGIPVLINYCRKQGSKENPLFQTETIKKLCEVGTDGIMLEPLIVEDDVLEFVNKLDTELEKYELTLEQKQIERFDEEEFEVRDYIIYNAYRITKELDIKAIVCFTENGYTSARIASLNPNVPVITFTKSNDTYRFLNLIWGVKGYKISQSFNYENLKRI